MLIAQTILNGLQIASPCSADWASMSGDERSRMCALCQKRVYDISALRADEALALIREGEGHLCVRLWRRADGTVLTADCPIGRRARQRRVRRMAVGAPALLLVALANAACTPKKAATAPSKAAVSLATSCTGDVTVPPAPSDEGRKCVVITGGAAISMDVSSARLGITLSSEQWESFPIR